MARESEQAAETIRDEPTRRGSRDALAALVAAAMVLDDEGISPVLRAATSYGGAAAAEDQPIEDAFSALLAAFEPVGVAVDGALLGAVVRGYTQHMVRIRGLVRRGGMGPLSSHVSRLVALHRINRAATASLDLDAMLRTVVSVVKETTGTDSVSIFLYEPESATLTLSATIGLNPDAVGLVRLPLGMGITGEAAVSRRTQAAPDAHAHPAYVDYPLVGDQPYASQFSIPLALGNPDRLVGVLNILARQRVEFDADELAFLETVAGELAIAIENARLYSETDAQLRQRLTQLGTLQQMSRTVASTLDLSEVLRLISRQTVELSQATAAEIYRRPVERPDQLELLARYPAEREPELAAVNAEVRELVEEVVRSSVSIWRRIRFNGGDIFVYALPMLTARRAIGAICIFQRDRPADAAELQGLLNAFSDSAAIAIENADLYEDALRGMSRASTLLQEMHHRVRNNLQTVAALLSMQARHAGDAAWTEPLQQAVGRIRSIAVVHDLLSTGNLRETTVDRIAKHVVDEASITVVPPGSQVRFEVPPSSVWVSSRQATVLALLINEFVANAVMHGLADRRSGVITVRAWADGEDAVLEVQDDGAGLREDFHPERNTGLGLQIARTLVEVDLRGSLAIGPGEPEGCVVRVRFPKVSTEDRPDSVR